MNRDWVKTHLDGPAGLIAVLAIFLITTRVGLDFGEHYDEWYFFDGLADSISNVDTQNRHYTYNGMYFNFGYMLLLPEVMASVSDILSEFAANPSRPVILDDLPSVTELQERLHQLIRSHEFLLDARFFYALISSLVIVWVYLTCRIVFPRDRWVAVLGAAFVGLSWEAAYHARFISVDGILAQFTGLLFLFLALFLREPRKHRAVAWVLLAAFTAGMGLGSKMTGLYLMVPVIYAIALGGAPDLHLAWRERGYLLLGAVAVALLTFIVTTPGVVSDPLRFIGHLYYERLNYQALPPSHPYFVEGFGTRILIYVEWLLLAVPSSYLGPALILSAVTLLGTYHLAREHLPLFLAVTLFGVIYVWFLSLYPGVYIRNALPLIPASGLFFAAGCRFLLSLLESRHLHLGAAALVISASLLANTVWLFTSANSIADGSRSDFIAQLQDYITNQTAWTFRLSPEVWSELTPASHAGIQCEFAGQPTANESDAFMVLFVAEQSWRDWKANQPGFTERVFSSHEVNYDYAPSWKGYHHGNRIAVVATSRADALGVDLSGYATCRSGS